MKNKKNNFKEDVRKAVAELPNDQFLIIYQHYWLGKSLEDIAKQSCESLSKTKQKLKKAHSHLKPQLKNTFDHLNNKEEL